MKKHGLAAAVVLVGAKCKSGGIFLGLNNYTHIVEVY